MPVLAYFCYLNGLFQDCPIHLWKIFPSFSGISGESAAGAPKGAVWRQRQRRLLRGGRERQRRRRRLERQRRCANVAQR